MKQIKKIVLENFQSHHYTEIALTAGLNVFVGPSDSGKSAILRGLRWVLFNQPRGSDYIRVGADRCRVAITMSDGVTIVRERSTSINRYTLISPEGAEQVFEGFGGGIPQEILEAHGMHPLKLDHDWELPIQLGAQLEAPFLLSESGAVKAKTIGRVSGAHIIDLALNQTASDGRALNAEIKSAQSQAEKLGKHLEEYADLDQMKEKLDHAQSLYNNVRSIRQRLIWLQKAREDLMRCRKRQEEVKSRLDQLVQLPQVEGMVAHLEYMGLRRSLLRTKRANWLHNRRERKVCLGVMNRTVHLAKVSEQLSQMKETGKELDRLTTLNHRLRHHRREIALQQQWLVKTAHLSTAGICLEEARQGQIRLQKIKPQAVKWRRVQREKVVCTQTLDQTAAIPAVGTLISVLEEKRIRYAELINYRKTLLDKQRRMGIGSKYLQQREQDIAERLQELTQLFKEVGQCPTCGSQIDTALLERILKEYGGGEPDAAAGRED